MELRSSSTFGMSHTVSRWKFEDKGMILVSPMVIFRLVPEGDFLYLKFELLIAKNLLGILGKYDSIFHHKSSERRHPNERGPSREGRPTQSLIKKTLILSYFIFHP